MIYLDNAATSWPKPESVYRAMDEFLRTSGGNPGRGGHSMAVAASRMVEDVRLAMARFINAPDKDRVIFTFNCTDSLNLGLKGLLRPGDHVITSSLEHNSVVRPLRKLEQQGVRVAWLSPHPEHGFVAPEDIEKAITSQTRLIVITHASNVNGVIQPIEAYGRLARRHNLLFMVDAAQTAGRYVLDIEKQNIDLLACSGHKGLLGPPGVGVLYIGERVDLDTLREGGTGSHSELEEQPVELPNKFECGTANTVGIVGLGAGLEFICREGTDKILAHEQELAARLLEGLARIKGVTVYGAKQPADQAPIVSLTIGSSGPGEVGTILDQAFDIKVRTGLHCAPAAHKTMGTFPRGTVRLSPGYFNTSAEIDVTLQAIEKIARMGDLEKHPAGIQTKKA
ncbi:MAG: aminotransferase class V-fold PLP-dependent enzyme [Chloroflexi bacterium]|nr:aminotransferase class V-fold PLP-dependent enzyme [Chloroflexota bacterium]